MYLRSAPLQKLLLLCLFVVVNACKTQDVFPTVTLAVSTANLSDSGGSMKIIARLNGSVSKALTVPIVFSGTAILNQNFSISATEITINAGVDTGFITLTSIPNTSTTTKQIIISLG